MCGRYYVDDETERQIRELAREIDKRFNVGTHYGDIWPTETAPVVVAGKTGLKGTAIRWGFPGFDNKGVIFNARSETAAKKRLFRDSLTRRRCIVPARHFYEWDGEKNRVTFFRGNAPVLYMAGIYSRWEEEDRFVILTMAANESMRSVHDRMPVILGRNELEDWIFNDGKTQEIFGRVPVQLEKQFEYYQERLPFL